MITNEEAKKAIEKYQNEHSIPFGTMIDVTAISSEEGVDIVSQQIEKIKKKVDEDTDLWCICEMAKMYMQGVTPVYPVKQKGNWKFRNDNSLIPTGYYECDRCEIGKELTETNFCPYCGADMRGEEE